ncbi:MULTISPECIES: dihydroxyacetone kinase phosphoryl donor subunit DhaM [Rathayibacter]|uniref:dihydroxyacetone kinase phosphoryl donor subunit DhaM n=1 Tax=Rathayibacter TaxID=33886 RepID=UPI000F4C9A18|nr:MULTISPECIES: dihydroxyacetone kinase phosphoryl donor subunit DhaM [Rathayibacter]MCJ1700657.1 PTS-dependent dihydroxyacetone kinase phosphotransferase subunit DhaM [Rathayibacter festucae]MCJ1705022.1 PTS-dependent dihydroxyacetone kinase phosphotransferase subunit DhaM [Rathayibacter sp. VKM Ac-2926]ROP50431.1 phosphocarrier protein HPr /dihydroxyacetone kinase DhaM subunit [Rathayibacter sp. PhB186]ROQ58703.1 phosphocarrier protein HPr /dihydroxyacetone kinase DhaM subunit [Rathayibacter
MSVGLVLVSHSARLAEGLVELAAQMAPDVALIAAGGTDDGGIGTSFERITAALAEADSGEGAVVLCDLGSAIMTAETAVEFLDDEARERVRIADAPLVEGAVAAAVAAGTGAALADVLAAAESARGALLAESPAAPAESASVRRTVRLINPNGLHARPAADFVTLATRFDARIDVNGKDATSLLGVMSLGLDRGDEVAISATGAEAEEAVGRLADLVESGFGEV